MTKSCAECIRVEGWRGVGVPKTCLIPHSDPSFFVTGEMKHARYNTRKARSLNGPCGPEGRYFWSVHQIGMPKDVGRKLPVVDVGGPPDAWDYLGNVIDE